MAASVYSSLNPSTPPLQPHLSFSTQLRAVSNTTATSASAAAAPTHNHLRVVFAAGGTGGHIYPAIAIADQLKTLNPNAQFLFVGTPTGMEAKAVPSAGLPFTAAAATPLSRPFISLHNLFFLPFLLTNAVAKNLKILREFDPHIVVGTGGFVSFPTCLAAAIKGVKLLIQEQNSVPGIANSVLSLFADRICVAFDSSVERFWRRDRCVVCGNPVRLSLLKNASAAEARRHFFPAAEVGRLVLVLGGSLGANAINIALFNVYLQMLSENEEMFIIWQTGTTLFGEMESLVRTHPRLLLSPFLHNVDLAFAAADLVVSRAGAMTCYEILATGKPCILIPSPHAAEGHQYKNSQLMADVAGSRVITEDKLDSATLRNTIQEIIDNDNLMEEMSERALRAAKTKASAEIAELILARHSFCVRCCRPRRFKSWSNGAMTCYEILATGKPCILIPPPHAAEGHQYKNAWLMADLAGSRIIMEDELNSAILRNTIQEIIDNDNLIELSKRRPKGLCELLKTKASGEIAELVISLTSELELSS